MGSNIIQKIWSSHVVDMQSGHPAILAIDRMLLHEVTSAQAFAELKSRELPVKYPERLLATVDHSIPTNQQRHTISDLTARQQVETLRQNCVEHGIKLYDFDSEHQGIVHVIGPELGFTLPGMTLVCGDSHTSTHGAFAAMAFGIGTSEVAHVLATGCLLQHQPQTMLINFMGRHTAKVSAKDIIMKLIASIGIGGAKGHIVEYQGAAISALSMEARMTLCNMSIECGARAGLIAPDQVVFDYLKAKPYAPQGVAWQQALTAWQDLASDPDCHYDKTIDIDVTHLKPMITWGINPEQAISIDEAVPTLESLPEASRTMAEKAYAYTGLRPNQPIRGQALDWAFVGSCTNGRLEDLRQVAAVLDERQVASSVKMYIVPGSEQVLAQAQAEGLDEVFQRAGAELRMPGCSMCLAMNEDKVPPGARCISTSNRNFMGRQGPGSITHLASPRTVAASAVAGCIVSEEDL